MRIERITEEKIETITVSDENFNLVIYAPPGKMKDEDVEGIIEDYRRRKETKGFSKVEKKESDSMYLPRHSCMLIWSGLKTLIVKEKHFEGMLKKKMNLCDDNYKYGDIVLTRMFEMTREEVDRSRKRSRLTDLDMEDWKGARTFYGYDFEFEPLEEPREVKVPHGAQTFFNIEKVDDWCTSQGGSWITVEGRHLCVDAEKAVEGGRKEQRIFHGKGKSTLFVTDNYTDPYLKDKVRSQLSYMPQRFTENLGRVELSEERRTISDYFGGYDKTPEEYKPYAEYPSGGVFRSKGDNSSITIFHGGDFSTFSHEFGHQIYSELRPDETATWDRLWKRHKDSLTEYGRVNPSEGLAEWFKEKRTTGKSWSPELDDFYDHVMVYG